jgi:hypothetical protein
LSTNASLLGLPELHSFGDPLKEEEKKWMKKKQNEKKKTQQKTCEIGIHGTVVDHPAYCIQRKGHDIYPPCP